VEIQLKIKFKKEILALGAESAGSFSFFHKNKIYFSKNFGDLLDEKNFLEFENSLFDFLKKNQIKPKVILTDLHPLYKSTLLGEKLAKKLKILHFKIQHHLAHIFSAFGEKLFLKEKIKKIPKRINLIGIATDGTGYGFDGKIWGGEVFKFKKENKKIEIERIGHLENQTLLGGELAIKEPARMLISIFSKFMKKEKIYRFIGKYYSKNQFEALFNQLNQNFNCYETSSTGRILDAVSVLLGFSKNQRLYKHSPIELLEKNSKNLPYKIKPKLKKEESKMILMSTPLFQYLVKNLEKDKKRLAATAQFYIAQGLWKIVKNYLKNGKNFKENLYYGGGIANNEIISNYLKNKGFYVSEIIPRGDPGISFGQCIYYLLTNSWDQFTPWHFNSSQT
jgi:hydrogenase maturation protein HypF